MAFMTIMIKVHTFPLFAIRPMYLAMRQFKKAVTDAIMSRRAIRNMNTLYPDATPEELQAVDNICIICRDEMVTGAKRLPCSHIFHTSCLRSWFQRQQTCPTCRMDVLHATVPTQSQQAPEQQEQAPQPPIPQAPNFPQGMLPPFPPGMFPMWPPMGPFPPVPGVQVPNNPPDADSATAAPTTTASTLRAGDAAGANTWTMDGTTAASVPGFPFPPPWMGMPMPPPFGFPPMPVPPAGFAGLTDDELHAMEGHERQNLEARLQCLQNIHTLLDAAMLQINQYLTVLATIGFLSTYIKFHEWNVRTGQQNPSLRRPPRPAPAPAPAAPPSPKSATVSISNTTILSTDNVTPSTSATVEDLASLDDTETSEILGAEGYTPLTVEEDTFSHEEPDAAELRRRRLQKLASPPSDSH